MLRIRAVRKRLGMTQGKFAILIGYSQGQVSDAEKDTRVEFNFLDRYMHRHASLVCQAVNVYIYDLNESKKQFYAKLGAEPEMRNLESEIDHAERIKARACGRLPS